VIPQVSSCTMAKCFAPQFESPSAVRMHKDYLARSNTRSTTWTRWTGSVALRHFEDMSNDEVAGISACRSLRQQRYVRALGRLKEGLAGVQGDQVAQAVACENAQANSCATEAIDVWHLFRPQSHRLLAEEFAGALPRAPIRRSKTTLQNTRSGPTTPQSFPAVAMMRSSNAPFGTAVANAPKIEPLGDFRVIRELGVARMGIVYEAQQTTLDRAWR